jgi:hypothetical protein
MYRETNLPEAEKFKNTWINEDCYSTAAKAGSINYSGTVKEFNNIEKYILCN